ncbi:unnamed protein product [Boreogadus saida]
MGKKTQTQKPCVCVCVCVLHGGQTPPQPPLSSEGGTQRDVLGEAEELEDGVCWMRLCWMRLCWMRLCLMRLDEAVLDEAALDEAVLDEAVLDEAVLDEAVLDEAVWEEAALEEAVLDEAVLEEAVLEEAVLDEAVLATRAFCPLLAQTLEEEQKSRSENSSAQCGSCPTTPCYHGPHNTPAPCTSPPMAPMVYIIGLPLGATFFHYFRSLPSGRR